MVIRALKAIAVVFIFCLAISPAKAQDLTGIWRGYFITEGADQYKYEVQISQSPTKRLTGVTYSYLDTRFYGKATFTGNVNTASNNALIQEIKTVEVRMSGSSFACIMKCNVVYSKSGNEEFLEGTYTSTYEQSDTLLGIRRGGNCGGGKLFLRKVPTSDFYVEPFLRDKPSNKPSTNIAKAPVPKTTTTHKPAAKPAQKPPAKSSVATAKKPAVKPNIPHQKQRIDTVKRVTNIPITAQPPAKTVERPALKIPTVTRSRSNELIQTLTLQNADVQVKLYDNGEIDGDTISVYLDNKLVLTNKGLSASPITLNLKLEQEGEEHVLVMVAENMGRIPPNTALMIVYDGDKRYEVRMTSTDQKNAMVRFRYKAAP
jgi:hypothetical protein